MCDENIEIGVTEITNNILVSATPTDQIIDINVLEEVENVELTITPSVVEVNIDVTQELITEVVTIDANTCVNIVDVTVTDATDNVVLNVTPSLVEVNINRGENNLSIEEYDTFADLPTIGNTDTYYITLDENKFWRWDATNEVYVEIASSDDKIPYLGAYKNSDLGEWGIKSNWFGLDTTPTNPPTAVGTLTWNDTDGTADLILKGGNVTLQIGQEQVLRVVNKTGATLNEADFRAVRVRSVAEGGAQGQRLAVLLAQADSDADSATTIGLVTENIANNQEGFITTSGNVNKINTTGAKSFGGAETWSDGDILYLSPTHAGYLTNVKPQAPNHTVIIGWVVYAHANNGKIFVKVDNGYELDELHNVKINSPVNKDALIYNSSLGVWENKPLSGLLTATSPLSITSNVISISQANATTDGYVSSADWNYFSAKQQPLSGTGFVKATGSVISYDNTVYTPQSRTLTINGTSYDLSADRSWSISVGSGMRNISSFVATSGQTTFTIVGGYTAGLVDVFVNGVRLNGGDYTATNGTTVVLSVGAIANDLVDIINYTASLTSGITGSGTTNYIPKWSGSSNLTNSAIYNGVYGVGIYTTTPRSAFEVNGQIYASNGGVWTEDGQGFLIGDLDAGASYAFISGVGSTGAASHLTFSTNYTERLRIVANGNVGIGLTNPAYKLDVVGDVNITGTYRVNGVAIGTGGGTVTGTGTANYIAKWSGTSAIGNSIIFDNGTHVGIGTASPDTYTQFGTGGGFTLQTSVTNGSSNINVVGNGSGFGGINFGNGTIRRAGIYGLDGSILGFYTNSTNSGSGLSERLRIDSSGNVGIGTTSPNRALVVRGGNQEQLVLISTTTKSGINLNPSDTTYSPYIGATGNSIITETSGSTRLQITSTGRVIQYSDGFVVGSGASNTVAGGSFLAVANAAQDSWVLQQLNASFGLDWWTYSVSAGWIRRMTLSAGGQLLLGTNTASGFDKAIVMNSASSTSGLLFQLNGVDRGFVYSGGGELYMGSNLNNILLYTNGSERMRITSGGRVLIATTSLQDSYLNIDGGAAVTCISTFQNGSGSLYHYAVKNSNGYVGGISTSGSSTQFNTSSDYRLKEDLQTYNGLEIVSKIDTYNYQWKADKSRAYGVIAHELQEILPYAVTGAKDGKQMQGVDYSKIVPVLVQAIKELNAKLEAK